MASKNLNAFFLGDTKSLEAALARAKAQTATFGKSMKKLGKSMQRVGKTMTRNITLPILAIGALSVKAFGNFDQAMTNSIAIMGKVSKTMKNKMEKAAKDVAKTTTFSAKEAAESYFFLASAGLSAKDSIAALPRVAAFAQAGNFDMALATDLLTDAQSALGLTIKDDVVKNMENMVRVSDVLIKANAMSNATAQEFSEALTNGVGVALKDVGKDLEEGIAVLAVFADQGIKGAEAGTTFGIVMRDLQSKAIDNTEAFDELGVAVFDSNGEMNNIADIIGDLEVLLEGMSDETKKATLKQLGFTDKSIKAMLALIGTSDALRTYEEAARDAGGTTQTVAEKQLETMNAKLKIMRDKLELIGVEIGEKLAPKLIELADKILKIVEKFDELSPKQQDNIIKWGLIAAAAGPVIIILANLFIVIGTVGKVLKLLTTPIGLVVIAMAAVVTAGAKLTTLFDKDMPESFDLFKRNIGIILGPLGLIGSVMATWRDTVKDLVDLYQRLERLVRNVTGNQPKIGKAGTRLGQALAPITGPAFGPALAHGGIVTKPTIALIGEAGPEAVVPLSKGMAGVTIEGDVVINANTDDEGRAAADGFFTRLEELGMNVNTLARST